MRRENLNIAALLAALCAAMVLGQVLDVRAEQPADVPAAAARDKRDAAARHACAPGESVVWVDASTHECLRELP